MITILAIILFLLGLFMGLSATERGQAFWDKINSRIYNKTPKNDTITQALNLKRKVNVLENELIQEKERMNESKKIAKKDLNWILN